MQSKEHRVDAAGSTVLVAGFEPFGGESVNPAGSAARLLDGETILGARVRGAVLSCAFGAATRELRALVQRDQPSVVLAVGQASGRTSISLERVAINVTDARIPDNLGAQPIDRPVARRGPVAYWSTLPIKRAVQALTSAGLPGEVSQTAGTFVCNHVFYGLMRTLERQRERGLAGACGGFVHVPCLPEQATAGQPSLPLDAIVRALRIVIETALGGDEDLSIPGGQLH